MSSLYGLVQSSVFCHRLPSYLIQPVSKIHFIALAPQAPPKWGDVTAQKELFRSLNRFTVQPSFTNPFYARVVFSPPSPPVGGCSNAARTGTSSFHPASLLRLLRNRPRRSGVRFSSGTGLLPRQSADPATSWRSNTSRHHVSGRTPSGCLLLQATLRGVVWLNADRFSSGQ